MDADIDIEGTIRAAMEAARDNALDSAAELVKQLLEDNCEHLLAIDISGAVLSLKSSRDQQSKESA